MIRENPNMPAIDRISKWHLLSLGTSANIRLPMLFATINDQAKLTNVLRKIKSKTLTPLDKTILEPTLKQS